MKNSIVVSAEFHFKGIKHSPSMVIDLDEHIKSDSSDEVLYPLLAKTNNIDTYSYEYEVLLVQPLKFSAAEGLAKNFLDENAFDFTAFAHAFQNERIEKIIADIARTHLPEADLSTQPELRAALLDAFQQGQQA